MHKNLNIPMRQYCNTILQAEFPTFKEHRQAVYKQLNFSYLNEARTITQQAIESGKPLTTDEQEALRTRLEQEAFEPHLNHYLSGWSIVVNSLVELGLAQELVSFAFKYHDSWDTYESVMDFILAVNQNHFIEAGVARITKRDLSKQSTEANKEQNATLYDQYIKFRNDHNASVDEARATLKHVKKRHAQEQSELKEEVRANIAKYKLEQERRLVDLDQAHTNEVIELKRRINAEAPSTFEAYKQMVVDDTEIE